MNTFALITDSVIDATEEFFVKEEIDWVPLLFTLDGQTVTDDLGKTISYESFYQALRKGANVSTSQCTVENFLTAFARPLEQGRDVVYIGFSSGLSGNYQAACLAANELREQYPDRQLYCVDSLCAAGGHGLLVRAVQEKRKAGWTAEQTARWAEENKRKVIHWFTVDDLFYLQRGGRVSKTAAVVGSLVGIKPILFVDDQGKLIPQAKVRGRRQSLEMLAKNMQRDIVEPEKQVVRISHGDCYEDAVYLRDYLLKNSQVKGVEIDALNNVIGAHSGPGTVALFCFGRQRYQKE